MGRWVPNSQGPGGRSCPASPKKCPSAPRFPHSSAILGTLVTAAGWQFSALGFFSFLNATGAIEHNHFLPASPRRALRTVWTGSEQHSPPRSRRFQLAKSTRGKKGTRHAPSGQFDLPGASVFACPLGCAEAARGVLWKERFPPGEGAEAAAPWGPHSAPRVRSPHVRRASPVLCELRHMRFPSGPVAGPREKRSQLLCSADSNSRR